MTNDHIEVMSQLHPYTEFKAPLEEVPDAASRREFLRVMGASIALASAAGCDTQQPPEAIVPYVQQPELLVPGKPLYYATAIEHDQAAQGLLVESHMFRPTKVEGNPLHPAVPEVMRQANVGISDPDHVRFGATHAFAQAAVLTLYDPERSQVVKQRGRVQTWSDFAAALSGRVESLRANQGAGLCLLTETILSPSLLAQLTSLQQELPQLGWYQWEPLNRDNELLGSRLAFGQDLSPVYRLREADVIVSLDADFLACGPLALADAHGFASRRQASGSGQSDMNRLYAIESMYTLTGAAADHRLAVRPADVEQFAHLLAAELGLAGPARRTGPAGLQDWARIIADDLRQVQQSGRGSLLMAGRWQPPSVHALAHWINASLGNLGRTVEYFPPNGEASLHVERLNELATAMRRGEVDTLLILGGNPVYSAPADLDLAAALAGVPFSAHLSVYEDETSAACQWHVPQAHFLEAWSDTRAADGTVSIVQPLVAPLYGGKTPQEIVAAVGGDAEAKPFEIVRDHWSGWFAEQGSAATAFDPWWQRALHEGLIDGSANEPVQASLRPELAADLGATGSEPAEGEIVAAFRPDPSVWDGRFAPNAWLQELPRPFTKITWDNAAIISRGTARDRQLATGDLVELTVNERTARIPVWVVPEGQPDGVVGLYVGYGRTRGGGVGTGVGVNVYPLRTSEALWFAPGSLRKVAGRHAFAVTQQHHFMEERHLVRHGTLAEYREHPEHPPFVHPPHSHAPEAEATLYPVPEYTGYKWGMSIDQSKCIGCNACVVACQAENNIPVVGKEQVAAGREMHWLRIDHYYSGTEEAPGESLHQPMLCQHCEYAPCEVVCPVFATSHSSEGLNEMTYNRCVGTRYCSNNCPYKVRRFNYFDYNADLRAHQVLHLLPNPDVTVRSRGVMEKCTFCVQRISAARIHAEKNDRRIEDGEVVTACQAACASEAIVFGDLNDASSRVRELSASPLGYGVLAELNTRPRITYLAAVKNRNPALSS
jgi:molybdopterin-containing oxidoreductase family iron-sulfur binding subunit